MNNGELPCTIAVDAMGGDLGPAEVVHAVGLALKDLPSITKITLVGQEDVLKPLVHEVGLDGNDRLEVLHASQVIGMDEKPIQSLKRKKDSSMVRSVELVRNGECQAVVSCGNTGSLMACGTLKLRPFPGVERPAIPAVIPTRGSHFILIDAGANPSSKPEHLVHNAVLGSQYARLALSKPIPRVGLLSIGTEEGKGNDRIHESHELLKSIDGLINYHGLIEGFQVFQNHVDVVVCDGFVGNILLKTCESLFHVMKDILKEELMKNPLRMTGAFLAGGAFKAIKKQMSPERYGGAPLLGLKKMVVKAHGSSNRFAIMNAVRIAGEILEKDLIRFSEEDIARTNQIIRPS